MARRTWNKGFAMAEALACIAIVSMFVFLGGTIHEYDPDPLALFPSDYLLAQSAALAEADMNAVDSRVNGLPYLRFTDKGNVNKAMTLPIGKNGKDVIVELGPGKLVFR